MKLFKFLIVAFMCSVVSIIQCTDSLTSAEKIHSRPVANAGVSITVGVNDSIPLKGTAIDNGTIVEYAWKFPNNPLWNVTYTGDTVIIAPPIQQDYICSLRVTDDDQLIGYDFVVIKVKQFSPSCETGIDTTVGMNDPIFLHGRATDESSILECAWKFGNTIMWTPVTVIEIVDSLTKIKKYIGDTIVFAPSSPQEYICSLRVRDNDNNIVYASQKILVKSFPPFVDVGQTISASAGSPVQLHASAIDNGGIKKWEWKFGTNAWKVVSPSSPTTCDTTIIVPVQQQSYVCSLRVTDVDDEKGYAAKLITIKQSDLWVNAGLNIFTGFNDMIPLSGNGGGDNPPFIYSWKINNYPWIITNKDTVITSSHKEEIWLCSLSIQDAGGAKAYDAMLVYSKSKPPFAKAEAKLKKAPFNYPVQLLGSADDEEGIREYQWKCGANGFWKSTNKDTIMYTPSVQGVYRCSLKVVDMDWETGHDFVDIYVVNSSILPYAGEDTVVRYNSNHTLHGQDLSNTPVAEWWWKIGQSGLWRRTSTSDTIIFTPDYTTTIVCSLKVVSTNGEIGFDDINLFVKNIGSQQIVYSRGSSNNPSIYQNDSKFGNEKYLTRGFDPKISPDGNYIVFYRVENNQNYIYRMNWNGQNISRLDATRGGSNPSWYKDSRHLAYGKYENQRYKIYKIAIDNSNNQELISIVNRRAQEPAVNPANTDEVGFFYTNGSNSYNREIYLHTSASNSPIISANTQYRYNLEMFGSYMLWDSKPRNENTRYLKIIDRANSTNVITIHSDPSYLIRGVFSKQGNSIYYIRTSNNFTYLYQCNIDGTNKIELGNGNYSLQRFDIK